ncbi:MYCBP-associated protein [Eumeta japonica]|uniref:MYCBP-associated protein n=1 Tax=Eumeta variegata TaxID=151549 RepID=A0A4C1TTY8_EUMVA|nr:MYCBP-associated protein [Eumeta japonica]
MEESKICADDFDPDRRLITWQRWVQNRRRECKALAEKLDRTPADLVMNLIDKYREKKEREYVLEDAQADGEVRSKEGLKKQEFRPLEGDDDEPRATPSAPNALWAHSAGCRVFEHVGVPHYIQKTEKGSMGKPCRRRCESNEYDNYLRQREAQFSEKIQKIDPFRPFIDSLYLKGRKPKTVASPMLVAPTIVVDAVVDAPAHELAAVRAIRINNTVISKDVPGQVLTHLNDLKSCSETCTSWSYYFCVPVKCIGRSKLFVQNLGTVTLRYGWKKVKESIPSIFQDRFEQVFFFNKNEDLLFPGQSREIVFSFFSDEPGVFRERWELSPCNVSFFDTVYEKLVVDLHADAVEDIDADNERLKALRCDIVRDSTSREVKSIAEDIVMRATSSEPEVCPYRRMCSERDIFLMKNPFCFYHQTRVEKLKEFYKEMIDDGEWDLSICDWRRAVMKKTTKDRMRLYGILKESYRDFLIPWHEDDGVAHEKMTYVKSLLRRSFDTFNEEFVSLLYTFGVDFGEEFSAPAVFAKLKLRNPPQAVTIHSIFYMSMRERLCRAVEAVAGVVQSLDSHRVMDFDICTC